MHYTIALAGSTAYTAQLADILSRDDRYTIAWVLSPTPRIIGRDKTPTSNPLAAWATQHEVQQFFVKDKIDQAVQTQLAQAAAIDFLLVVDFGYFVPRWLLALPKQAPLNIHPSLLPAWRGSSPGQFALLHRELLTGSMNSAVTLMIMNEQLDQGPIITQLPFTLDSAWTQTEYYQHAFALIGEQLGDLIAAFASGEQVATPQSDASPTIIARRLERNDSFVPWQALQMILQTTTTEPIHIEKENQIGLLTQLLADQHLCTTAQDQALLVRNASHAFAPWPGLWTIVPTKQGSKRLKIWSLSKQNEEYVLEKVQLEGKTPCLFQECKNAILEK